MSGIKTLVYSLIQYINKIWFLIMELVSSNHVEFVSSVILGGFLRMFRVQEDFVCECSCTSSFLQFLPLLFPLSLLTARTSRILLSWSSASSPACCLPDLRGEAFRLGTMSVMFIGRWCGKGRQETKSSEVFKSDSKLDLATNYLQFRPG